MFFRRKLSLLEENGYIYWMKLYFYGINLTFLEYFKNSPDSRFMKTFVWIVGVKQYVDSSTCDFIPRK